MKNRIAVLLGVLLLSLTSLFAQSQNTPPPAALGGYDQYGNAYAPQNHQYIAAANWTYLTTQYTNATATFSASGLILPAVLNGVTIPARCTIFWQSSNIAATVTVGLALSNANSSVQVLNTSHTGANGATLADNAYSVSGTTQTAISPAMTAGTANTTYRDDIDLLLTPGSGTTSVTILGKSSTTTAVSFMPGSKCVWGE